MKSISRVRRLASSLTFCLGVLAVLMACNLGTSAPEPPTLAPRPSVTPEPTLGVSGTGGSSVVVAPDGMTPAPITNAQQTIAALINQVEVDRLMAHVDALQNFHTRHVNSTMTSPTTGIGAAREYIKSEFQKIGAQGGNLIVVTPEFDLTWGGVTTRQQNVVAIVQGTEPGGGTIIVGAHYDSIVIPDFKNGTAFAPGANDNGTGVATLIEMARIMASRPHRSSIMFVAFSAEEVGRKGSIAFADYVVNQNIDVFAMINIDTVGNQDDGKGGVNATELRVFSNPPNDTSPDRQLARTAEFLSFTQQLDMKLRMEDAIDRESRYGDHFSFTEKGIPSIRFINAYEEKINGDPTDTIEYIEPAYFRRAVQSILVVVSSLADGPRPPRNLSLRPNKDDPNGQLVWEPVQGAVAYIVALRFAGSLSYNQQFEIPASETSALFSFGTYEGVAVSVRGADGIVGPLSAELKVNK